METLFRTLRADEIDVRVQQINNGGVRLLLYKDARCDQNILDETVGPMNWQRSHSRDNANCTVSIYDPEKQMWVSKEDTGVESNTEKEKGLASDSFKRACFNWGIGRELYTAPDIFVPKAKLKGYQCEGQTKKCSDAFRVTDIKYDGNTISSVTIEISLYGTVSGSMTFTNRKNAVAPAPTSSPAPEVTGKITAIQNAATAANVSLDENEPLRDDEEILMGNCRGKKYGEVKGTDTFIKFLTWAKTSNTEYQSEAAKIQFKKIKKLAQAAAQERSA